MYCGCFLDPSWLFWWSSWVVLAPLSIILAPLSRVYTQLDAKGERCTKWTEWLSCYSFGVGTILVSFWLRQHQRRFDGFYCNRFVFRFRMIPGPPWTSPNKFFARDDLSKSMGWSHWKNRSQDHVRRAFCGSCWLWSGIVDDPTKSSKILEHKNMQELTINCDLLWVGGACGLDNSLNQTPRPPPESRPQNSL